MSMTVKERADRIATFRHAEVRLMEMVAAWIPTTPEMEVKVLLGKHVWDLAQHADALGKRVFELRRPLHDSRAPDSAYAAILEQVAALPGTEDRIAHLYEAVLPGLERRYRDYLAATDALLDGPSVVILERIVQDVARQRREAEALRHEIGLADADVAPVRSKDAGASMLAQEA
jgi:hypothetical protein